MSQRPPAMVGRSGQLVGDRYELLSMIGSGGQSVVYRARDRVDGDVVALKILGYSDRDAAERMYREALVMSQLSGTAAVRILHQVYTHDGALALVMELLDGQDLSDVLAKREAARIPADTAWVKKLFDPIVHTLDAAHDRGIVHRDIKTENVFVVDEAAGGGVRLLDFGFAKLLRSPTITGAEVVAGSPSFLAPEVWINGSASADVRADVWAFGVVLFRVLGGCMPFTGGPVELMQAVTAGNRPSLHSLRPDLHPDVDGWVAQVFAPAPEHRFSRITATWRALTACF